MIELTTACHKVFLNVNGKRIAETEKNDHNSYSFSIDGPSPTAAIYACNFGELPSIVQRIFLDSFKTELMEYSPYIGQDEHPDGFSIELHGFIELKLWNQTYSPDEFIHDLKSTIARYPGIGNVGITDIRNESFGLRLVFPINDSESNIGDSLTTIIGCLKASELQTISACSEEDKDKSLASYFSFPEELRTVCEQYLLYFGEFLRDIGINVSVELKEETDRVLFSVTPRDSNEALDRIRQVLDLYLGLPTATVTTTDEKEYSLESQRLSANIMHYHGQLMLAQAVIEQKDATIGLLKERLVLQGRMKEGRLLPGPTKELDKEVILGGVVEIRKYEGKGFAVNLPKLLRDLREWIQTEKS